MTLEQGARPLTMNVDALRPLPFRERILAYEDFDTATRCRNMAHWHYRVGGPAWLFNFTFEMREALRAWKRYATAVRAAGQRKAA